MRNRKLYITIQGPMGLNCKNGEVGGGSLFECLKNSYKNIYEIWKRNFETVGVSLYNCCGLLNGRTGYIRITHFEVLNMY